MPPKKKQFNVLDVILEQTTTKQTRFKKKKNFSSDNHNPSRAVQQQQQQNSLRLTNTAVANCWNIVWKHVDEILARLARSQSLVRPVCYVRSLRSWSSDSRRVGACRFGWGAPDDTTRVKHEKVDPNTVMWQCSPRRPWDEELKRRKCVPLLCPSWNSNCFCQNKATGSMLSPKFHFGEETSADD